MTGAGPLSGVVGMLAGLAAEKKVYAAIWVLGVFVAVPAILIFATVAF